MDDYWNRKLHITETTQYSAALFGAIGSGSSIKNVTTSGTIQLTTNCNYATALVAHADGGTINNCHNTASVSNTFLTETTKSVQGRTGGLVAYIGGVAASIRFGIVENCYNIGEISGYQVGGVVESTANSTVRYCYNMGKISGTMNVGGVVSHSSGGTEGLVEYCYNTGEVNSTAEAYGAGGVIGYNGCAAQYYYNTGNVTALNTRAGGIAYWSTMGSMQNCYNTGNITGDSQVGGVVGLMYGSENTESSMKYCYNTGNVVAGGYDFDYTLSNVAASDYDRNYRAGGIAGSLSVSDGSILVANTVSLGY